MVAEIRLLLKMGCGSVKDGTVKTPTTTREKANKAKNQE
jgi:hypothetical protein